MITENKYLTLTKSGDLDLAALASGGLLPTAYQRQFFVRAIESAKLLPMVTMKPMGSYIENLPAIKFSDYVLAPGAEGTALDASETHVPTLTQPTLTAHLFKAKVPITREALKDNVQGGTLLNLVMEKLPAAVARDMERIIVRGDTTSGTPVLAQLDGILKQATTNVYAGGSTKFNADQIEGAFALLANEYKEDPTALKILTAPQAERAWQNEAGERLTAYGDRARTENLPAVYRGTNIMGISAFTVSASLTNVLLCDPKNIVVGIWQDVDLRIVEEPVAGKYWILGYLRFDVKYQDEEAVAKITSVSVV